MHTLTRKTYANGQVEKYTYQSNKYTVTHKSSTNATTGVYTYNLDSKGNMTSQVHQIGSQNMLSYTYNTTDKYNPELRITGVGVRYGMKYNVRYNQVTGKVTSFELSSLGSCESTEIKSGSYSYDDKGRLKNEKEIFY